MVAIGTGGRLGDEGAWYAGTFASNTKHSRVAPELSHRAGAARWVSPVRHVVWGRSRVVRIWRAVLDGNGHRGWLAHHRRQRLHRRRVAWRKINRALSGLGKNVRRALRGHAVRRVCGSERREVNKRGCCTQSRLKTLFAFVAPLTPALQSSRLLVPWAAPPSFSSSQILLDM
jgi:hypothetical protein